MVQKEAIMPNKLVLLSAAAALLFIGSGVFEANATTNVWAETLSAQAKTYSPLGKASCTGKDYSASRAPLYSVSRCAFVCPAPVPRQYGSSITNIKAERPKEPRGALYKKPAQLEIGLSALPKRRCVA